jgi:hypothetical protein
MHPVVETRREAFAQIRNLIDRTEVRPNEDGCGTAIEFKGRLEVLLKLAASNQPTAVPAMWVSSGAPQTTKVGTQIIGQFWCRAAGRRALSPSTVRIWPNADRLLLGPTHRLRPYGHRSARRLTAADFGF